MLTITMQEPYEPFGAVNGIPRVKPRPYPGMRVKSGTQPPPPGLVPIRYDICEPRCTSCVVMMPLLHSDPLFASTFAAPAA